MKKRKFNLFKAENLMSERYDKAVEQNDHETLEWFAQFKTTKWETQMIQNACQYEQYTNCGYSQKPIFNENGWLRNGRCEELLDKSELVSVFVDGRYHAEVRVLQHPNGKWVAALSYILAKVGGGSYPSVWHDQYPSRSDAIGAALEELINHIEVDGDKKYLPLVRKMRGNTIHLTLF